jgi:hypothetical protein
MRGGVHARSGGRYLFRPVVAPAARALHLRLRICSARAAALARVCTRRSAYERRHFLRFRSASQMRAMRER